LTIDAEKGPILNLFADFLKPNGIIYVTNGDCIWPQFLTENVPKLRIDWDLTEATDYQTNQYQWQPKVLRKVS